MGREDDFCRRIDRGPVKTPGWAGGIACKHGVLRLRSASPLFAQDDRVD